MRTKKVNRYWCDFCNKAGLSASSMAKHEKHCTMNPNRECRVCKMVSPAYENSDFKPAPLHAMIALLPSKESLRHKAYDNVEIFQDDDGRLKAAIPVLRAAAGNCPACMLAAIRQAGIPVPLAEGFDFTKEMQAIWADINEAQLSRDYY